jgi:hypothetical protein
MKSFSRKLFAVFFSFGVMAGPGIHAQLPPNGIEFKAPFSFVTGTSNLPAGDYTIRASPDDPDVLTVSGPSGKSIFTYCEEIDLNSASAKTEISFRKYDSGTTRFLKQITVGGSSQGCSFASGETEKKAKKSGSPSKDVVEGNAK